MNNFTNTKQFLSLLLTKRILFIILMLGAVGANAQITVSGAVSGNGSYTTLGAAITAIGTSQAAANIVITVTGNTTETTSSIVVGAGTWATMSIQPSGGSWTITAATTAGSPMIDFNGADNVTIDGLNSGGNSLTISNTTASATSGTSTIRFIGGATNNTITNCNIQGSGTMSVATNGATIFFSTDAVTANGNDNNTISNNNIGPAGANLPTKAILGNGSTTTTAIGNSGIVINNNNIFDYFGAAVTSAGIATNGGCNSWSITNNRFYQTGARTWTTGALHNAMNIGNTSTTSGAQGFTITGNIVGYASNTQTGTYTLTGSTGTFRGIVFNGITGGTVSNINNNTVAEISVTGVTSSGTSSSAPFIGIYINNGVANTNSNTIGSQLATGSLVYATTSTSAADMMGIFNFSADAWTANNNLIGGMTASNAGAGAANAYGIRLNTSASAITTLSGNTIGGTVANSIQSTSTATGAQVVGILITTSIATATSNTIRNLTNAGGTGTTTSASVIGISFVGSPVNTANQNTIFNLSNTNATAATVVTGIQFNGGTGNVVQRNLIYDLSSATNSASAEVNGIRVAGGTTIYRNNMIRLGSGIANAIGAAASNSGTTGVNGINEALGTNSFFHNSVYLEGSPTAGTGTSYAFNGVQTTNTRSFRDNIFFNARSNSGATGKHYALKINGTTPNPTGLSINNNIYFANGTGAVFGFFNSLDVANLAVWKTAVGQDAGSFESNPQYNAPGAATPDLHIHPSNPSVAEGNGVDVGVTEDYDGQTRSGLTPVDIGADAGNFSGLDLAGPVIVYTVLANTSSASNRNLVSVTITDNTGVPTSGALQPRIWFRRSLPSPSSWVSTQGTLQSGTGTNGVWNFTIDYAQIPASPVAGETYQYYVVAQDIAGIPNISTNPAGGVHTDVNTQTSAPTTPNSYIISVAFSGSFNVGIGETYTSLTNTGGIFEAINVGVLTGNVTINVTTDLTTELGTVALNQWAEDGVGNYSLLIKPFGAPRTITGSINGGLVRFNGADRVTIDGSLTGASVSGCLVGGDATLRELTIQNTNTGTGASVISFASGVNGAQNNSIKNVQILGQDPTTTLLGISIGGATPGTTGIDNDNNRVENCSVKRAIFGIYCAGANLANQNNGNVITKNDLSALTIDRVRRAGILAFNENGLQVTENSIAVETNESADAVGIGLGTQNIATGVTTSGGITNALVSKNKINGIASLSTTGFSAIGIAIAGAAGGANVVQNNMISGVSSPATSPDFVAGICVVGAIGSETRLYYNSISMTGDNRAVASQMPSYGIAMTGSDPVVDMRNNILYTTQTSGGGASALSYAIGSESSSFVNLNSNYNIFWSSGANDGGFRTGSLAGGVGTSYATLALWAAAIGDDANSLEVDPLFVDPLNNLHLTAGNFAATPIVGISDDYDCDLRNVLTPNIGADESLCATAIAGTASGNSVSCASYSGTITATGYSTGVGSTYQWMSSSNITDYSTSGTALLGQTNPSSLSTGTVTNTTYYWLRVTCATLLDTAYSNLITVTVNPLPTPSISGALSFCPGGSSVLDAGVYSSYNWSTGATTQTITVNASGTYSVVVTDANSCSSATTVNVTINPQPTPTISGNAITCNGGSTVLDAGAYASYSWSTGATTQTITASAGNYTVTVTDAFGCTGSTTYVLAQPPAINVSATHPPILTLGGSTTVTVSATGGSGSYTSGTGVFAGVTAGTYTYNVVDNNGCTGSTVITITQPGAVIVAATPGIIACNGGTTSVNVSATGGSGTYVSGVGSFTGVAAGTYTYTVVDNNSNSGSVTITITQPAAIVVTATPGIIACNGGTTSVVVTATGGTGAYTGTGTFTNRSAGINSFTVTDANNCPSSAVINISQPSAIVMNVLAGTIACNGGTTSYTVTASGGTGSLSGTGVFTNISSGTYTIIVSDANSCTKSSVITIAQPTAITVNATAGAIICNGGTTTVNVSASGGTGTITGTGNFTNVAAGTYTYTVTDANGCTKSAVTTITQPAALPPVSNSIVRCNSYLWPITGQTYTNTGTYSQTVLNGSGCVFTQVLNLTINYSSPTTSFTATACDSYLWTGTTYTVSGNYTKTFTNASGCDSIRTLQLTVNQSTSNTTIAAACDNYIWGYNGTTYTISGTYTVTSTNPAGCVHSEILVLTITPTTTASSSITSCGAYTWYSNTYTASGTYTRTTGCHIETLILTINSVNSFATTLSAGACYVWPINGASYSVSGMYTYTLTNPSTGCLETHNLNLTILPGVTVATKVLLGGPYVGAGLMHDSLRVKGMIPTTPSEPIPSYVLAVTGPNAIVDWVTLELRDMSNSALIVASKRALVQRDGDIVSNLDGISPVFFSGMSETSYYISVKHRNHLGVMTLNPVALYACPSGMINFSDLNPVYTKPFASLPQRKQIGSVNVLWSGDANSNKNVRYNGSPNDKDAVLIAVTGFGGLTSSLPGYRLEDVNMDGNTKYNGLDNDRSVILNNVGVSTPNAVINQHTPN